MVKAAAVLVGCALGLIGAVFADELGLDSASAARALPQKAGPYAIVWVREPSPTSDLRCFVARTATASRAGVWLCG